MTSTYRSTLAVTAFTLALTASLAMGCGPMPTYATGPTADTEVVPVAGDPSRYYLIDHGNGQCWYHDGARDRVVDCRSVPRGGVAHADPAHGRLGLDGDADLGPSQDLGAPTARERSGAPAVEAPAVGPAPSAYELERFTAAYTALRCDRVGGGSTSGAAIARDHGLSPARYHTIEAWAAQDRQIFAVLVATAVGTCGG